jgi:hypothetical protein
LVILVHYKLQAQRFTEMEIVAMAGRDEANGKALDSLLDRYRQDLFPGMEKPSDPFEEMARRRLAEETKKVYLIKPLQGRGAVDRLQKAAASSDPGIRSMAKHQLEKERLAMTHVRRRLQRSKTKLPPGVVPEKR